MRYRVYGLTLASEISLPELTLSTIDEAKKTDVQIRYSTRPETLPSSRPLMFWTLPTGELWLTCTKENGRYRLRFPDLADFSVDSNGEEIMCVPGPQTPPETLRHLLLDQVLPLVLDLKGRNALHATAVLTPLGVCAFAGPAGVGKSTLAASFLKAGYPILSDDCLALKEKDGQICAIPAYPGLRLWKDSLAALGKDQKISPVAHYTSKKRLSLNRTLETFRIELYPLARIYSVAETTEMERNNPVGDPVIEHLSGRDSFMALLPFSFVLNITDRTTLVRHFRFLEKIASHVPVRRLHVPDSFSALAATRELILADLEDQ